ncbi:hypothetical protein STEG23_036398, partial [Scotinomys teguina]
MDLLDGSIGAQRGARDTATYRTARKFEAPTLNLHSPQNTCDNVAAVLASLKCLS